jgi:hypothetical protein
MAVFASLDPESRHRKYLKGDLYEYWLAWAWFRNPNIRICSIIGDIYCPKFRITIRKALGPNHPHRLTMQQSWRGGRRKK